MDFSSASFAFERFIATEYWSWYERAQTSTLWVGCLVNLNKKKRDWQVLVFTELFNLIPAFGISYLAYTGSRIPSLYPE